jgi:hypothetical protein
MFNVRLFQDLKRLDKLNEILNKFNIAFVLNK